MRPATRLWSSVLALAILAMQAEVRPGAAADAPAVHVRASAAFAPCLSPAFEAFTRATGVAVVLTVAEPDPPQDADLVVGDDVEMTRLLEGGRAELATAVDLGEVPWVLVVPPGSPEGGIRASATEPIIVLGGAAGREARAWLGSHGARVEVTTDGEVLRRARRALVPRSLAGSGDHRPATLRPLVATAAVISGSPRAAAAHRLRAFLAGADGRRALGPCFDPMPAATAGPGAASTTTARGAGYAQAVVDWWVPQCSLQRNRYNDPEEVLGPPDAVDLGGVDNYLGFMSLGQGGYVTIDAGGTVADGAGPELRVYQTTAGEPVTVYASASPEGPFTLIGLRVACGVRSAGVRSNHCDFDLRDGGVAAARYFKVEDGEIYPCLAGGTATEGADIDAVEILGGRP